MKLLPKFLLSLCLLVVIPTISSADDAATQLTPRLNIGMNLSEIADYVPGFPFKNLMWGARPWATKNADGSGPYSTDLSDKIPLDPQGYPLEIPFTVEGNPQPQTVFTIIPNVTEAAEYILLYDGEGEITAAMNSSLVKSEPGRVVLNLAHAGGSGGYEGILIKRSAKENHIHNIRILAPADEKADLKANPFREDFLAYCKQWHALRFMVWMFTNNSLVKDWDTRKKPDFYTMVGTTGDAIGKWGKLPTAFDLKFAGGVPPEIMIQLCNMTGCDPWFNMPHRATPQYMEEFAKLVKAQLDPKRKVYVEYSNEVWNWGFQQSSWMIQSKDAAEGLEPKEAWKDGNVPTEFPLDNGTVAKEGGAGHPERMGVLDRRCFTAWEKVFTGDDKARLVRLVGVQSAWADTAERTAKWVVAHGGADAICCGGYFGASDEEYKRWTKAGADLTGAQVIKDLDEDFDKGCGKDARAMAAIARETGLKFMIYEGGQGLQPEGQKETAYMPALKAAQYDPGLYKIYMKNFALHQELGCELFMAFESVGAQGGRYGSWGHMEHYGQSPDEIPKYKALIDANTPKK